MKKTVINILITLSFYNVKAQVVPDTIYYNKEWKETIKDSLYYYRLLVKENSGYKAEDYYSDGKLQMSGYYSSLNPEIKEGYFSYYTETGSLKSEGSYMADEKEGEWKKFSREGHLIVSENYKKGKLDGSYTGFYENGNKRRQEEYKEGKFVRGNCYTLTGEDTTFFEAEIMPEYKGGINEMFSFIQNNLKYPAEAKKNPVRSRRQI